MLKLPLLLLAILISAKNSNAQHSLDTKTWHFIDTALSRNSNLSDLTTLVNKLELQAFNEKKYFEQARCIFYKIIIADKKTEDTLYFKNSAILDSMLLQPQAEAMQYCLYLLRAIRLSSFITRYNSFNIQKYRQPNIPVNYAAFSYNVIDSIAQLQFEKAKLLAHNLKPEKIESALWLSSDAYQFLNKPDLFDIAIAEQISSTKKRKISSSNISIARAWISYSPDAFIESIRTIPLKKTDNECLQLYTEWLLAKKENAETYYFIETLVHKYAYENLKTKEDKFQNDYEKYLTKLTTSKFNAVKVHSVYQLCLLWNSNAKNYFPSRGWQNRFEKIKFDTAYQYHYSKSLQLFNANKLLLDSFYYLKNILLSMEQNILRSEQKLTIERYNLPGNPVLAELKFKNTDTLFYKILNAVNIKGSSRYLHADADKEILSQPVIRTGFYPLENKADFNYHNTYLTIDKLIPGDYVIMFSNKELNDSNGIKNHIFFTVTTIAVLNTDTRLYVLHRQTGLPLTGAAVTASYTKTMTIGMDKKTITYIKKYIVNKRGYVEVPNSNYTSLTIE